MTFSTRTGHMSVEKEVKNIHPEAKLGRKRNNMRVSLRLAEQDWILEFIFRSNCKAWKKDDISRYHFLNVSLEESSAWRVGYSVNINFKVFATFYALKGFVAQIYG